jgi:hypothetical protein
MFLKCARRIRGKRRLYAFLLFLNEKKLKGLTKEVGSAERRGSGSSDSGKIGEAPLGRVFRVWPVSPGKECGANST